MDRAAIIRAWLRGKGTVELAETFQVPESAILRLLAVTRLVNPTIAPGATRKPKAFAELLAAVEEEFETQRVVRNDDTSDALAHHSLRIGALFRAFPTLTFQEFMTLLTLAGHTGLDAKNLQRFLAFSIGVAPWTNKDSTPNWTRQTELEWAKRLATATATPSSLGATIPPAMTSEHRIIRPSSTDPTRLTKGDGARRGEETERADMSGYLNALPSDAVLVETKAPFRPYEVRDSPFLIGREASGVNLLIADIEVSRTHAAIIKNGQDFFLEDKQSSNGTLINGRSITHEKLRHGDLVQFGYERFLFYPGIPTEAAVREAIYASQVRDPLTRTMTPRVFAERLASECDRATHSDRPLSFVRVEVEGLVTVNELFEKRVGDGLLKEVASLLNQSLPTGAIVSRLPAGFAILLPEIDVAELLRYVNGWATTERIKVAERSLQPRLRTGYAFRRPGRETPGELSAAAELALSISQMCNDSTPTPAPELTPARPQPIRSGETLIHRLLADQSNRPLLALSLVRRAQLVNWRQVLDLTSTAVRDDEYVASIKQRYVLVASAEEKRLEEISTMISDGARTQGLNVTMVIVGADEVSRLGLGVLDVLPDRLIPPPPKNLTPNDRISALPFTIAAPIAHIATAENLDRRFDAARFALERSLSFVVGTQLSVLRRVGTPQHWSDAAGKLRLSNAKTISMGKWVELATTLSQQLHGLEVKGPASVLTRFATATGARTPISNRLESVTTVRNLQAHGRPQGQVEVNDGVKAMLEATEHLQQTLLPLSGARLISQQGIRSERRDGTTEYSVREHVGASEVFAVVNQQFRHKLFEREWCYFDKLLGDEPVLLAPWVFSARCPRCDRNEVFVAPGLSLNEQGDEIELRGVTTDHELTVTVPDDPELAAFMSAVLK